MARLRTSAPTSLGLVLLFTAAISLCGDIAKQQTAGQIIPTGNMKVPRSGHTATLLRDGTVLMAGGMLRNGDFSSTAEIFDPKTNQFSPVKNMLLGRVGAAAALLPSGRVLIAGGWYETDEAEIYDPATRSFAVTARMNERRARPTATVLRDGTALITGGEHDSNTMVATNSAEVYDEHTGKFTRVGAMHTGRVAHTATLLQDGRVLVAGGGTARKQVTQSVEIYDPKTRAFSMVAKMSVPRYKHTAVLLNDGTVLIAGGSDAGDWETAYNTAEIYNPRTNGFTSTGKMAEGRFKLPPEAVQIKNSVLIFGGAPGAALYDERGKGFLEIVGSGDTERFYPSATLLEDGRVLLAGGYPKHSDAATRSAWLYVPAKP
jgi:hypothetical protein